MLVCHVQIEMELGDEVMILSINVFPFRVGQPSRVARRVLERSPHSFLVGEGAEAFAREQGFVIEHNSNMLSDHTATAYQVHISSKTVLVCSLAHWSLRLTLYRRQYN